MPFISALQKACALPIVHKEFQGGYAKELADVSRPGTFELFGLRVRAPAGVYSPHETSSTRFFMSHFRSLGLDKPPGNLLEIGCGAGAISLMAARLGWDVLATDIDPLAVATTRENALFNAITLDACKSDLFSSLEGQTFDVILFNLPPYHVERPIELNERSLTDSDGLLYVRFMREAKRFLKPGGFVALSYANIANPRIFEQPGWHYDLRAFDYEAGANLTRALYRATPLLS